MTLSSELTSSSMATTREASTSASATAASRGARFSEDTPRIPAKTWKPSFANKTQTDARIRSGHHCDTRLFGHAKGFEMRMVEHVVRLRIFVLIWLAEHSLVSGDTATFVGKASHPLWTVNIHHAAKSVRISAFRVAAVPAINTIKHIGEGNMPHVNASSFKCDFIHPIFRDVFPHSPNCDSSRKTKPVMTKRICPLTAIEAPAGIQAMLTNRTRVLS